PPGNHAGADFGGEPRALAPAAPHLMTAALRRLKEHARGLDHAVAFEVTHHGPALGTPAFFIEIGSSEAEWRDPAAGRAVAQAVADVMEGAEPMPVVLVGVGGGHYAPRFTDIALGMRASFGHMIPSYHMGSFDAGMLERAARNSGADGVYVHRKGLSGEQRAMVRDAMEELGLRPYREADLGPLP
ncbi:MAG: D-aminoacyl-tRNA deacylase, partial [Thermoplasmata archaeon]|nr:D-aminoacyl-tRNA deacylase [Thermoplasmata archaeon]